MRYIINALVWLAAAFFNLALRLSRRFEPLRAAKVDAVVEKREAEAQDAAAYFPEAPDYAEDDSEESGPVSEAEGSSKPFFRGENGEAIPVTMDPMPEFRIFEAMFNRKYGKFGRMPMSIAGTPRLYNVYEIYTLLEQISKEEEPNPMMQAIYGSVMTVIMKAHGEKIEPKYLN